MTTRISFVVKKEQFPVQNGDEKGSRRQKIAFFASKWRREGASSSKNSIYRLNMATRISFVAKIEHLSPQNGDEKGSRRQKIAFLASKW
ncbi:hypothetical protein P5F75_12165 [Caldifermentibacillus hisashii]|uniref:hypothetical protein n=1 Tax=Caldifermentibacillus hisashii TaxID=996558 RepID=UPI002E1A5C5E|nr:hypothetical protein [Caldifermentibacillus hisashii]